MFDTTDLQYFDFSRKAEASLLAVDERQALDTLNREEKTASRTFTQLNDKQEEFQRKREKLKEDIDVQGRKKDEVAHSALLLHELDYLTTRNLNLPAGGVSCVATSGSQQD